MCPSRWRNLKRKKLRPEEPLVPGNALPLELLALPITLKLLHELDSLRLVTVFVLAPATTGARFIAPHPKRLSRVLRRARLEHLRINFLGLLFHHSKGLSTLAARLNQKSRSDSSRSGKPLSKAGNLTSRCHNSLVLGRSDLRTHKAAVVPIAPAAGNTLVGCYVHLAGTAAAEDPADIADSTDSRQTSILISDMTSYPLLVAPPLRGSPVPAVPPSDPIARQWAPPK